MWQFDCIVNALTVSRLINSSINEGDVLNIQTAVSSVRNLNDTVFTHSIGDKICTGIEQNGTF